MKEQVLSLWYVINDTIEMQKRCFSKKVSDKLLERKWVNERDTKLDQKEVAYQDG